tara:strand:- start:396 stop:1271 length:876 start_codon:yes stop_codon:yes gene_type:complete
MERKAQGLFKMNSYGLTTREMEEIQEYILFKNPQGSSLSGEEVHSILIDFHNWARDRITVTVLENQLTQWRGKITSIDRQVQWTNRKELLKHGIDPRWFAKLRQTENWVFDTFKGYFPATSYREALQWQYVLDFAGSDVHEPVDIFVLGGRFYLRHFYGIINNEAPHTDDLQAHISYRPWEQKQEPRYISALNAKRIPPLSIDHSLASSVAEGIITVPGTKHAVINLLGALSEGMEISWGQVRGLGRIRIGRQYLLPSQILDLLHKQRGGKPLIVFLKTIAAPSGQLRVKL